MIHILSYLLLKNIFILNWRLYEDYISNWFEGFSRPFFY